MKEPFIGCRTATPSDEEAIFNLLCIAEKENAMFPMNDVKVMAFIQRATRNQGGIIGIIDGPNGIEASVGLTLDQSWYSDDWYLGERWNFVHPDHRKTGHVDKLIGFSKWCSDSMDIPLDIGILSNIRTEAKIRLYKRHFEYKGAFFMYNSKH